MPVTRTPYTPPAAAPLRTRHAEAGLIIVDKPAGLLTVPGRGPEKADCLLSRLRQARPGALIVHRLDLETSGLVVFALDPGAQRALFRSFAERRVEKAYEAVIDGAPEADAGEIDLPLAADWPNRPKQAVDMSGKPSLTRWRVIERGEGRTRVELEPVTGRTHQLRVHLAAIGHPILGDTLYGDAGAAPRLLLHARSLAFDPPGDGARVKACSPAPF